MLADFAALSLDELTAEIESMLRNKRDDERARADRFAPTTSSPATAGPSRDASGDFIPLDRAVAGALSTATRSGQVTPSPADTAARGDLLTESA